MSIISTNLGGSIEFIYFICILNFVLILYLLYCNLTQQKEHFDATTDAIKTAMNTRYGADVEAIRNLSDLASRLIAGGLTVPGSLSVTGGVSISDENTMVLGNSNNLWLMNCYKGDKNLGIRGNNGTGWTDSLFLLNQNGNMTLKGGLTVNSINMNSSDISNVNAIGINGENILFIDNGTQNKWLINNYRNDTKLGFRGWNDTTKGWTDTIFSLDQNGTVTINGNLSVTGNISCNGSNSSKNVYFGSSGNDYTLLPGGDGMRIVPGDYRTQNTDVGNNGRYWFNRNVCANRTYNIC